MITFENVTKRFGGLSVLKDVTFHIAPNETVAVLGPSGSGKTTVLKLIAGLLKPDSGTVRVQGSRVGFIFQDHRLLLWRTAQDNIALPLIAAGKSREDARRRARSWMDRMGLRGFYDYFPAQLSGGMAQRVSIARAFAYEPDILLMDEPFSSLEPELSDSLMRDLKQVMAGYRATTVLVTHEFPQALSLARRIFRLEASGLRESLVTDPRAALKEYFSGRLEDLGLS